MILRYFPISLSMILRKFWIKEMNWFLFSLFYKYSQHCFERIALILEWNSMFGKAIFGKQIWKWCIMFGKTTTYGLKHDVYFDVNNPLSFPASVLVKIWVLGSDLFIRYIGNIQYILHITQLKYLLFKDFDISYIHDKNYGNFKLRS